VIRRLEQAEKPKTEGRRIAIELMQQLAEIDGISGIHLMAYKQEEWIGEIVSGSGLLGTRKPWAPSHLEHIKQPS
jgi:methylenetetrahydrofolate reductase (NADPH)